MVEMNDDDGKEDEGNKVWYKEKLLVHEGAIPFSPFALIRRYLLLLFLRMGVSRIRKKETNAKTLDLMLSSRSLLELSGTT